MQKTSDGILYFPTDLVIYLDSPFAAWMDSYHARHPGELSPEAPGVNWLGEQGLLMEGQVVVKLEKTEGEVRDLSQGGGLRARVEATKQAMQEEVPVIYQGALVRDNFAGYCDVLLKREDRYEPAEIKLASACRPHFLIQLCAYAQMLEAFQKEPVQELHLFLGDGSFQSYAFGDYRFYFETLKDRFLAFQQGGGERPEPGVGETAGRWQKHLEERVGETDSLVQVAGITGKQVGTLSHAGVLTMARLGSSETPVPGVDKEVFSRLSQQARLQKKSLETGQPCHEVLDHASAIRQGLQLLPPSDEGDVFFDFEGYPLVEGGLEYLFGVCHFADGDLVFRDWWAHNTIQERSAFEQFVDWVWERRTQFPNLHIYHYGDYEVSALRKLMGKYGTREEQVDELLRQEVFVNLHGIVRQGIRVGEPSYSIKYLERHYDFGRGGEVQKAVDSIAEYGRWLDCPDGPDWKSSRVLKEIRDYNQYDCESTQALAEWLRGLQVSEGLAYVPPAPRKESSDEEEPAPDLATPLSALSPPSPTLAQLLGYHRREEKPQWWAHFDRLGKTDWELKDDMDCLGDLRLEGTEPQGNSLVCRYRFGGQETKLKIGGRVAFLHQPEIKATIESLQRRQGRVAIKLGPAAVKKVGAAPARVTLIPADYVPSEILQRAIQGIGCAVLSGGVEQIPSALGDLLERRSPRVRGLEPGSNLAIEGEDSVQRACELAENLDHSALVIQGPPGAGKTYLASHLIAHLVGLGKKVGVTSNSHAVINHLLNRVREVGPIPFLKIAGSKEEELAGEGYFHRKGGREGFTKFPENVLLVGGTAWAFGCPEAKDHLDYLFVDEAGQVSLANVAAMAASAKNLILLGDPQQLEQPTQGSHPDDSGKSSLSYVLQNRSTIDPSRGLFLSQTRRMHPDVCRFISETMYEGRLLPHPLTSQRQVMVGGQSRTGIQFIPVAHEGNGQYSPEEVKRVVELCEELLAGQFREGDQERPMEPKDILVVAPFNLQVVALKDAVPGGVEVGTVDKFQGREAPVSILSLASSGVELSPRGMDFIFSPNRLNVAISRAQCLSLVVANPALALVSCPTVDRMRQVNGFCRLVRDYPSSSSLTGFNP